MPNEGPGSAGVQISRRAFTGIALAALAPRAGAQPSGLTLHKLHNFEIRVTDVAKTVEFYQRLFGMPAQSRSNDRICLRVGEGPQHMSIRAVRPDETPAIVHLGYSIVDFDPAAAVAALQRSGFEAIDAPPESASGIEHPMTTWTRDAGGVQEVYFADARGLIVQLCDPGYCGSGTDRCAAPEPVDAGVFTLRDLNHFTVFVNDGAAANRFYQSLFGLSVQAYQGPQAPVTGIGDGFQFVMYAGPPRSEAVPASIHHACFNMPNFEVEEILARLTDNGLTARGDSPVGPLMHYVSLRMPERGGAEGGTPELYFTDPDGLLMQLQDVSYCGGGGYLGAECV